MTRRVATLEPRAGEAWLDAAPFALIGLERDARVVFLNAAAELLLAGRLAIGRLLGDVVGADAPLMDLVAAAFARGSALGARDVDLAALGLGEARGDVYAAPLEGGRRLALTIVMLPSAEVEPRPVSALARKLAHEVRNPLAGIRAAAQLIGKTAGAEHAPLVDLICAETDRISRLTDRIDALEGLPPPHMARVNVHEALERARLVVAASFSEVRVQERYDPSLPPLLADGDQLIQAFLNIAKNGAEAALAGDGGEHGEPQILLSTAARPGVRMRARGGGASRAVLEIGFEDNGPGLPDGLKSRAFEPFFTTKRGGAGLGLAIAAEIVSRHGGRIEVESRPGKTQFRILLPFHPEEMG